MSESEMCADADRPKFELLERIRKCQSMIGKMCSEGRPPLMQIPAAHNEYNEDIYICDTLRMMKDLINESF